MSNGTIEGKCPNCETIIAMDIRKDINTFIDAVAEIIENAENDTKVRFNALKLRNKLIEFKFVLEN